MNSRKISALILGGLLVVPGSLVLADEAEPYQMHAIMQGDLGQAESELLSVLEENPNDPYAMLNLAFIYQKSGYSDKARDMYMRILSLPEDPLAQLASGKPERIKLIARRGLGTVAAQ